MSFREVLLESLQPNTKRFQKKVRKNPPIKKSDISSQALEKEIRMLNKEETIKFFNELCEENNIRFHLWDYEAEYINCELDGFEGILEIEGDAEYIVYDKNTFFIAKSLYDNFTDTFRNDIVEAYNNTPHIFEKYGIDIQKCLK